MPAFKIDVTDLKEIDESYIGKLEEYLREKVQECEIKAELNQLILEIPDDIVFCRRKLKKILNRFLHQNKLDEDLRTVIASMDENLLVINFRK
ncbi:hypothetical protein DRO02_01100 [archaeon]|nr:MAG: hypothetical protein DRO02_01100 [archaeon]RLG66029.1 MAG: hypothetical protein DRO21_00540 [archaeon]RLG66532.1 MAG: hypothetical protein DRN89_00690 [archaeon]HDM23781.1 hypothetical protein [Candidatus Bathyarchaeota archaeon]